MNSQNEEKPSGEKVCKCGHNRDHREVDAQAIYTPWAWFVIAIIGISMKPRGVRFLCTRCHQVIDEARDVASIRRYTRT